MCKCSHFGQNQVRKEVIGNATLYLGDCLEILPTLPKVDAVITDPPYGIGFSYESARDDAETYKLIISGLRRALKNSPLALLQYPEEMMRFIVPEFGAPDDVYAWCYNSNTERQLRLWGFWNIRPDWKAVPQKAKNFTDPRVSLEVRSYDWCSDIQQVKNVGFEKTEHPCQIPTALIERIVRFCHAQSVIDPFMGSGTTGVACMNLGRKFIGIEIEPKYFEIACERITNAQRQERLFA